MVKIVTNSVPRDVLDASELSAAERAEFDYLDWAALEAGEDSASFVRYGGRVYDLGEFMAEATVPGALTNRSGPLAGWGGYMSESFFSGLVVRFVDDGERVIVGRYSS